MTCSKDRRIVIPVPFRDRFMALGRGSIMISQGPHRCCSLYPWDVIEQCAKEKTSSRRFVEDSVEQKEFLVWISGMTACRMDKSGRVVIPRVYAEWAGISDKVLLIGVRDHLELWNPGVFQEFLPIQDAQGV